MTPLWVVHNGCISNQWWSFDLLFLNSLLVMLLHSLTGNWWVNTDFSDFKVDAVSLNDLDFWDKGNERGDGRNGGGGGYVVTSRPGHLEARWEQPHRKYCISTLINTYKFKKKRKRILHCILRLMPFLLNNKRLKNLS